MIQALNSAMDIMLARDPAVVIIGQDIGVYSQILLRIQVSHGSRADDPLIKMQGHPILDDVGDVPPYGKRDRV